MTSLSSEADGLTLMLDMMLMLNLVDISFFLEHLKRMHFPLGLTLLVVPRC
jgi:hypothetical protein